MARTARRRGQPDLDEVVAHERRGRGNAWVSAPSGSASGVAVRPHQPAGERRGAAHRDLLAEDGAHRDLEAVPRAGHAQAGAPPQQPPERGVAAEHAGDGERIAVEVEDVAHAADHAGGVAEQRGRRLHEQRVAVGRRRDLDDADASPARATRR